MLLPLRMVRTRADNWTRDQARIATVAEHMIAVIGNVLAGLGVLGLFTATLRLKQAA